MAQIFGNFLMLFWKKVAFQLIRLWLFIGQLYWWGWVIGLWWKLTLRSFYLQHFLPKMPNIHWQPDLRSWSTPRCQQPRFQICRMTWDQYYRGFYLPVVPHNLCDQMAGWLVQYCCLLQHWKFAQLQKTYAKSRLNILPNTKNPKKNLSPNLV